MVLTGVTQQEPGKEVEHDASPSNNGLTQFATRWEINDLVFRFLLVNLKTDSKKEIDRPWYTIVPNSARQAMASTFERAEFSSDLGAILAARALTGLTWLAILGTGLWQIWRDEHQLPRQILRMVAWFLLLQPTLNPWYWVWVMPWLCFARNRGWYSVSGVLLLYYLRFWLAAMEEQFNFFGWAYTGAGLFDHVIVWLEFGIVFFALILCRKPSSEPPNKASD